MPIYEIETDQGTFEIDADREPTHEEAMQAISGHLGASQKPQHQTETLAKTKEPKAGQIPDSARATGLGLLPKLATPYSPLNILDRYLKDNPEQSEKVQSTAEGALNSTTAGLSDLAAKKAGADLNSAESPRFRQPYYNAGGEIGGALLPSAGFKGATTPLSVIKAGSKTGGLYGLVSGVASEAMNDDATLSDIIKSGAITGTGGAVLGAALPAIPFAASKLKGSVSNALTPSVEKHGETYRKILAPGKQEIKNVEVKAGRDLKDSYELAAKEKLIIDKSSDGKLDTKNAIDQLQESLQPIHDELSQVIASKPQTQFSLREIAEKAKSQMRETFKNDADYEDAIAAVEKELSAAIKNRGEFVNGVELNQIKQGMWSKGYNALAPNSNKIARIIGNTAKDAIETAYKDADISGLNKRIGDYITLQKLLENAHGRVVARGKLGKYAAQGIGAIAGHTLGIPVAGELGGAWLGGKVSDFITDPSRITQRMAKRLGKVEPESLPIKKPVNQEPSLEAIMQDLSRKAQSERSVIPKEVLLQRQLAQEKAKANIDQYLREEILREAGSPENLRVQPGEGLQRLTQEDVDIGNPELQRLMLERGLSNAAQESVSERVPLEVLRNRRAQQERADQMIAQLRREAILNKAAESLKIPKKLRVPIGQGLQNIGDSPLLNEEELLAELLRQRKILDARNELLDLRQRENSR